MPARTSRRPFLLALGLGLLSPIPAMAQADALSAVQRDSLLGGHTVLVTTDVPGQAWPRVDIFRLIRAPAIEVAAVVVDYEHQPNFAPRVKETRVVARPSVRTADVAVTLDVPIVSDEHLLIRQSVSAIDGARPDGFFLAWSLLSGTRTRALTGTARIAAAPAWASGAAGWNATPVTLFHTQQLVTPSSMLARFSIIRNRGIEASRQAADALAAAVETQHQTHSPQLAQSTAALRAMLAAPEPARRRLSDGTPTPSADLPVVALKP